MNIFTFICPIQWHHVVPLIFAIYSSDSGAVSIRFQAINQNTADLKEVTSWWNITQYVMYFYSITTTDNFVLNSKQSVQGYNEICMISQVLLRRELYYLLYDLYSTVDNGWLFYSILVFGIIYMYNISKLPLPSSPLDNQSIDTWDGLSVSIMCHAFQFELQSCLC